MKYRDPETGEFKEIYVKAVDTLPIGSVVDYDGEEIPAGWEEVDEDEVADEIGSNDNGHYIKYANGVLICRGKVDIPANTSEKTITMPYPFILGSTADVIASNRYTQSKHIIFSAIMKDAKTVGVYPIDIKTNEVPTFDTACTFLAIGYWK